MRGSSSHCRVAGPRVSESAGEGAFAQADLGGGVDARRWTSSEPRKVVRLGLWPTTSTFSYWSRHSLEQLLEVVQGGLGGEGGGEQDCDS